MIIAIGATIFFIFFLIFFFRILALFANRSSKRSLYDVLPFLHQDNPGYLEELFHSGKEIALAETLGQKLFRNAQIKRIRLALEWLGRRAMNATALQEWAWSEAKKTRVTRDLDVRTAAEGLEKICSEYRLAAGVIQRQLQRWLLRLIVLPFIRIPFIAPLKKIDTFDLLESYEKLEECAVKLAQACGGDYYDLLVEVL